MQFVVEERPRMAAFRRNGHEAKLIQRKVDGQVRTVISANPQKYLQSTVKRWETPTFKGQGSRLHRRFSETRNPLRSK